LSIENCVIRNLTGRGIDFVPNAASSLAVSNTLVADNGGRGINVGPTSSGDLVTAIFNRVEVHRNVVAGITLNGSSGGPVQGTVTDSVAAYNGGHGFGALTAEGGHPVLLGISRSVSANNDVGVEAVNLSGFFLAQSTIILNQSGVAGDGFRYSFGDNYFIGNTVDGPALLPALGKK
jgi:hypothetical protein